MARKKRAARRHFRWTKEARDLVRTYILEGGQQQKFITELANITGHPRSACLRFARKMGLKTKRSYKKWSEREIADLKRLHGANSSKMIAAKLSRTVHSVRTELKRLGMTARVEADRFTKYTLAMLVHARPEVVQEWIDKRGLKAHREGTDRLPRWIIMAEDFICFCKRNPRAVLGRRLNEARLEFVCKFIYPPGSSRNRNGRARSRDRHRAKPNQPDVNSQVINPEELKKVGSDYRHTKAARIS